MKKGVIHIALTFLVGAGLILAGAAHAQSPQLGASPQPLRTKDLQKVLGGQEATTQGDAVKTEKSSGRFAPAEFQQLDDSEKLSTPSFEQMPAGVQVPASSSSEPPIRLQRDPAFPGLDTKQPVRPQPLPRAGPKTVPAPSAAPLPEQRPQFGFQPVPKPSSAGGIEDAQVVPRQPLPGAAPPSRFGFEPADQSTDLKAPTDRPEAQRPGVARPENHHNRPPRQALDHPAGSRFPRDPHNVPGGYSMDSLPSRSPAAGGPMPDRERDMPHREAPHRGMGPAGAAKDPPSGSVFDTGTGPGAVSSGSSSGYVRSLFRGLGGTGGDQQAATPGELRGAMGRDTAGGLQTAQDASAFFGVLGMFFDSAAVVEIVADLIAAELEKQLEEENEGGEEDHQASSPPRADDGWVGGGEPAPTPRWDPTGRFGPPSTSTPQDDERLGGDGEGRTVLELNVTQEAANLEERRGRYRESGPMLTVPLDRFEQVTDPPTPDR